jgi:hypothetical protein
LSAERTAKHGKALHSTGKQETTAILRIAF